MGIRNRNKVRASFAGATRIAAYCVVLAVTYAAVLVVAHADSAIGVFAGSQDVGKVLHPGSASFDKSTGAYTISGSGTIAGSGGLTKSGSSTLTISTANTYSGGTSVSGGKLMIDIQACRFHF